jgi:hypothetical protein
MSIRGKAVAAAAVVTLAGGVSAVGTLSAQAATPSCYEHCIELYSQKFGSFFILDVPLQRGKAGQPITLYRSSNSDPAEDFTISTSARVSRFAAQGLVSPALAARYGGTCERFSSVTHKCVSHYPNDWAYEFEYVPEGTPSGLCMGVAGTAGNGTKVVLEPCGSARTVWVADGSANAVPLISGTDTSVSDPYVLNYPVGAIPYQMPTPQLNTRPLARNQHGGVLSNQLWSANSGPVM